MFLFFLIIKPVILQVHKALTTIQSTMVWYLTCLTIRIQKLHMMIAYPGNYKYTRVSQELVIVHQGHTHVSSYEYNNPYLRV